MGGSLAHEFMVLNHYGEDTLVLCDACGYADNQQIAEVAQAPARGRGRPARSRTSRRPTRRPSMPSPRFLGIAAERTAKATFFVTGDGRFVVAIVRGDYDVNETKLVNAIKATGGLRPAQVEEIKARGMEAGYGSPIGARDAVVVVDELVAAVAEPRRRREPARLARAQRQRAPRLHARRHRRRSRTPARATPAPTAGRR